MFILGKKKVILMIGLNKDPVTIYYLDFVVK